jgi:hypothetical protein
MIKKLTNQTAGKILANQPGFLFIKLSLLLFILSGCAAEPIKPPTAVTDEIRTVLVVPVESPPLEVIPDLLETRMPVYGHFKNMTLPLFLEEKIYRNPGGVLISGLLGDDDIVPEVTFAQGREPGLKEVAALSENWTPTFPLAQEAASQLNAHGIKAVPSKQYYRLPIQDRTAYIGHWRAAVEQWFGQAISPVDYRAIEPVDAVLELGIGTYKIFAGQTSIQVLIKLIDPQSGRVIARTEKRAFSAEDSAQALLSREAETFKALVAETGARLLDQAFSEIGLTQGRLAQSTANLKNEPPYGN